MNNIYAKTMHKEYNNTHDLHPITSARRFEGTTKAPATGFESPGSFSINSIFVDKKAHMYAYWSELHV